MNELKRLSNFYDTFQKLQETSLVNDVIKNKFNFGDEKRVREAIALYFSNNYEKTVDDTIEELKNYQLSIDELRQ